MDHVATVFHLQNILLNKSVFIVKCNLTYLFVFAKFKVKEPICMESVRNVM